MATLRELKTRIGSVASSEKITGAMKMISSAKMRKAEVSLRRLVPYRRQLQNIICNILGDDTPLSSPLTQARPLKNIAMVVFGSDDGLCGAYNTNMYKYTVSRIESIMAENPDTPIAITLYPIGKKMSKALAKIALPNVTLATAPDDINSKSDGAIVDDFTRSLVKQYTDGEVDSVHTLYMHFHSAGRQRAHDHTMIPVTQDALAQDHESNDNTPYIFEPDVNTIYRTLLPMLIMSQMQEVFTQNRASEQAARVMAMQSANDNAKKLLEQLQLEYNKLRQQSITNELLDIVGGQVRDN